MLTTAQIQLLLEISLAGSRTGQVLAARDICAAILIVKPDFAPARIALAFSHIVVDEFDEACTILYGILQTAPDDADALIMLGLAETLANNSGEARKALTRVRAGSTVEGDPRALIASTLLAHIDGK